MKKKEKRKVSRINSRLREWFDLYVCVCCDVTEFLFIIDYWKWKERKEVFYDINKYIFVQKRKFVVWLRVSRSSRDNYTVYAYTYSPETRSRLGSEYSDINIRKAKSHAISYFGVRASNTTFRHHTRTTTTIIMTTLIIIMTISYYSLRCTEKCTSAAAELSDGSH